MRRVGAAWNVIQEEGLVGRDGVQLPHMLNRIARHSGDQVPAWVAHPREDRRVILEQIRSPLVRLAGRETIEIRKTHAGGPLIKRSGGIDHPLWCVVVLAEPGRGIAVVPRDRADGRLTLGDDGVVAGVAGSELRDYA